jgi:hypothetical protein
LKSVDFDFDVDVDVDVDVGDDADWCCVDNGV